MNQELNRAMSLFQANEFAETITLCEVHKTKHPMFELLLASALGKLGHFDRAHELFKILMLRYPANPDISFNQALIFKEQGLLGEAENALQICLKAQPAYHPAWNALGNLQLAQSNLAQAEQSIKKASQLAPNNLQYIESYAQVLLQLEEFQSIVRLLTPVLAAHISLGLIELMLIAYYELTRRERATKLYEFAFSKGLYSFTLYFYASLNEVDEKRFYRAKQYLSCAEQFDVPVDEVVAMRINNAFCELMLSGNDEALKSLANSLDSMNDKDKLFLARLLESLGEFSLCRHVANTVATSLPNQTAQKSLLNITLCLAENNFDEADRLLGVHLEEWGESEDVIALAINLAEQTQQYSTAVRWMDALTKFSNESTQFNAHFEKDVLNALSFAEHWQPTVSTSATLPPMIFIVGFPRSGTTLLESKLSVTADCLVLEETSIITSFIELLKERCGSENYISWLLSQSEESIITLQREYLRLIEQYVGPIKPGNWVLDKMPFNCMHVPLINILFPHAKIIWAHRHPKDIYLSCLQKPEIRIFEKEGFLYSYDHYLQLWERFKDIPAVILQPVYYERFVENPDDTIVQLSEWAGLKSVGETNAQSKRIVLTPSYQQVREGVYEKATHKYRHYLNYEQLWDERFDVLSARVGYSD